MYIKIQATDGFPGFLWVTCSFFYRLPTLSGNSVCLEVTDGEYKGAVGASGFAVDLNSVAGN